LAHRRLGLIVPPDNPLDIQDIPDLLRARFVNRQVGTGTRIWLAKRCQALGIDTSRIDGYDREVQTHLQIAGAVAEMQDEVGLAGGAAGLAYGVCFARLTTERSGPVITEEAWPLPGVQALVKWLQSPDAPKAIQNVGGYDVTETGNVE